MFRKKALERLSSPEQLDKLLIIVKPSGWLALLTTIGIIIGVAIWASQTLIPIQIDTRGIIITPDGLFKVRAKLPGVVQEIFIKKGDFISAGTPIVRLYNKELEFELLQTEAEIEALTKFLKHPNPVNAPEIISSQTIDNLNTTLKKIIKERNVAIAQEEEALASMENNLLSEKISKEDLENQRKKIKALRDKLQQEQASFNQMMTELEEAQNASTIDYLQARLLEKEEIKATLVTQIQSLTMESPVSGVVLRLNTTEGQMIQSGQNVLTLEQPFKKGESHVIVGFIPVDLKGIILPDMPVKISLPPTNDSEFESIEGVVTHVSPYAVSEAEIEKSTISDKWANYLLPSTQVPSLEIVVTPLEDINEINYKKQFKNTPMTPVIESGEVCDLKITISQKRPLSFLFSKNE